MENVKLGTIKAISNKKSKNGKDMYAVNIDDIWFSGFGICPVKKGDEISLTFEVNNGFNNIKDIKVTKEKTDVINEAAHLRRVLDCVLGAKDLVMADKIKMEQMGDTARGLFELMNEIGKVQTGFEPYADKMQEFRHEPREVDIVEDRLKKSNGIKQSDWKKY